MAGYSKRSLVDKLGIKSGFTVCLLNRPDNYLQTLGELPANARVLTDIRREVDFIQFFARQREELQASFPSLKKALARHGMLWVSWPKKASKVPTNLDGNIVRGIGLANRLVDIKVCAVDEVWSGLKFVYRKEDR